MKTLALMMMFALSCSLGIAQRHEQTTPATIVLQTQGSGYYSVAEDLSLRSGELDREAQRKFEIDLLDKGAVPFSVCYVATLAGFVIFVLVWLNCRASERLTLSRQRNDLAIAKIQAFGTQDAEGDEDAD